MTPDDDRDDVLVPPITCSGGLTIAWGTVPWDDGDE